MQGLKIRLVVYGSLIALILGGYFIVFACKKNIKRPVLKEETLVKIESLRKRLQGHVETLAGEIGERNAFKPPRLSGAASYIRKFWEDKGYRVLAQAYEVQGVRCENLWVQINGTQAPDEIVLVGAHYDSVWGSPGADDNASGVGALLEISNLLFQSSPARSIRFVAFTNEEPPFFQTDQMGSYVYAKEVARRKEKIVAMVSLETIGYYNDRPRSQQYPPIFGWFYPSEGNFLAVVGNVSSRSLVKKVTRFFQEESDFPVECISAPRFIQGVDWSDQASFWDHGYPGVMVTDTALYRYPHYHEATDLPDKLNYPSYARVVYGLAQVIRRLANE